MSQVFAQSVNFNQRLGAHDHRDRTRFSEIVRHERNQEIDANSIGSCLCFRSWFVVSVRGRDFVQAVHGYVRFSAPAKLQPWRRAVRVVYTQSALQLYTQLRVCIFRSMRCERGRVRGRRCVSVGARARARARVRGRAVARVRGPAGPRVRGLAGPRVRGSAGALARAYSGCVLQAQGVSISARESLLVCGSQCWCVGVPLDMWESLLTSPILAENDT